jgi:hypothetical protein
VYRWCMWLSSGHAFGFALGFPVVAFLAISGTGVCTRTLSLEKEFHIEHHHFSSL